MTEGPSARAHSARNRPAAVWPVLLGLASLKAALHLAAATVDWGYAQDELYFLDSTNHLDWGYVDHPPLSIVALAAVQPFLGDSLLAIRAVPALLGAVTVVLGGMLAREMGGALVGQSLAALMILGWPAFLAIDSYYSLNAFDAVFWMIGMLLVLRILPGSHHRLWLALGAVIGAGLLNKWTVAALPLSLALGLIVGRDRHWIATRWPWLAATLALALVTPNLVWQAYNGWPTLEFVHNAAVSKNVPTTALAFLRDQVMMAHPLFAPLWMGGLAYLLLARQTKPYRLAAYIWIAVFGLFMASGAAKSYYVAPAYPVLLAAGACAIERISLARKWRWLPATALLWVVVAGIAGAPFALPILTPQRYIAYQRSLGLAPPKQHVEEAGPIPLHLAVRLHGRAVFDAVSRVYEGLPPQRARSGRHLRELVPSGCSCEPLGPRTRNARGHLDSQQLLALGTGQRRGRPDDRDLASESRPRLVVCRGLTRGRIRLPVLHAGPDGSLHLPGAKTSKIAQRRLVAAQELQVMIRPGSVAAD